MKNLKNIDLNHEITKLFVKRAAEPITVTRAKLKKLFFVENILLTDSLSILENFFIWIRSEE